MWVKNLGASYWQLTEPSFEVRMVNIKHARNRKFIQYGRTN